MGLEHVGHWIGSWNSRGSKLKRTCCSKNTPIIPKHVQKLCSDQAGGGSSLSRQILWLGFPARVLPVKWPTESFKRETWGGLDRIFKWLQTGVTARVDRVPIWLWKYGVREPDYSKSSWCQKTNNCLSGKNKFHLINLRRRLKLGQQNLSICHCQITMIEQRPFERLKRPVVSLAFGVV